MRRERIGTYEATSAGGEQVRAFVPAPLPPVPVLDLDDALQPALESAVLALGRLDGISTLLPDRTLFLYDALKAQPILSLPSAGARTGLAFRTTATAMALLVDLDIARETTGKRRGRLFVHDRYLAILNEGTEPFTQRYRRDDATEEDNG